MKTQLIADLTRTASRLLADDSQDGFHFPRGTLGRITTVLAEHQDGTSHSGRQKYREGTVAAVLDVIADSLDGVED